MDGGDNAATNNNDMDGGDNTATNNNTVTDQYEKKRLKEEDDFTARLLKPYDITKTVKISVKQVV